MSLTTTEKCDDAHVWKLYRRGNLLGQGNFGNVRAATHRKTLRRYAVKSIKFVNFSPANQRRLREEIGILQRIDHPNVVRLYEVYESETWLYLVLELCLGRTVVDAILDPDDPTRKMSERETLRCIHKLLLALRYCHELGIVHRDVKPENFVYENGRSNSEPKLIDFGLSNAGTSSGGTSMQTFCGTLPYQAPEMFALATGSDAAYDSKVDMWAVGVTAYFLLCGQIPFCEDDKATMGVAVTAGLAKGRLGFTHPAWKTITREVRYYLFNSLDCMTEYLSIFI